MKKFTDFLVSKRILIASIMLILLGISFFLMDDVNINYDMTKYLPSDSTTRAGMDIMEDEFPSDDTSSLNIMFSDLSDNEKNTIHQELSEMDGVNDVDYDIESDEYNKDNYTLYKISVEGESDSELAETVFDEVKEKYNDSYEIYTNGEISDTYKDMLSPTVIGLALACMVIILLIMCESWLDPLLILITIGVAIVLNIGTNSIFESVSHQTNSIAAILQVVLSIDYAIILITRYRQERKKSGDKIIAMKEALHKGFGSITSSSLTTIIGLLCLIFMSFTIGRDMGLVLAKGVLWSLVCVFTILPTLVLMFDKALEKTKKKILDINFTKLGTYSYKYKNYILVVFIILFVGCFYLRGNVNIGYTLNSSNKIDEVFGTTNTVVVLYENDNEQNAAELVSELEKDERVEEISAYTNTFGKKLSASELAEETGMNEILIDQAYTYYFMLNDTVDDEKIAMDDFIDFAANDMAANPQFKLYLTDDVIAKLDEAKDEISSSTSELVGKNYSRIIINTDYAEESDETTAFLDNIYEKMPDDTYIVGNSQMAYEMSKTFKDEINFITILTAIAIFIVVALTFGSLLIPLLLVGVIQASIFLLMGIASATGSSMYYLALLIVQSILMGATIDYAIVYTSYFKQIRKKRDLKQTLIEAYNKSYHTILTSSSILILVTLIVGKSFTDKSISDICLTISKGTACALVLILFFLPGIIASVDRFISKRSKK